MKFCTGVVPQAAVALRLAQGWGDALSVTTTPVRQQACLSAALVEAVGQLGKAHIEGHAGLLPALLTGVSVRLESPLPAIRCGTQTACLEIGSRPGSMEC